MTDEEMFSRIEKAINALTAIHAAKKLLGSQTIDPPKIEDLRVHDHR